MGEQPLIARSRGAFLLFAPFAVPHINDHKTQQTTVEMDWCRVVGPRGLCRPLDEKPKFPTNNSLRAPERVSFQLRQVWAGV